MTKTAYFILPLVGLNTKSFGPKHFVDCYLSPNREQVVVVLNKIVYQCTMFPNYMRHWYLEDSHHFCIEFYIPSRFFSDVNRFSCGSYRKMSDPARKLIGNAIEYVTHTETHNEQSIRELHLQTIYSRHLSVHIAFDGKRHNIIAPPLFGAIAPSNHGAYQAMKKLQEERCGTELPDDAEVMSPPDMGKELCPDHIYRGSSTVLNWPSRAVYEKK